jgi:hypothetical protein
LALSLNELLMDQSYWPLGKLLLILFFSLPFFIWIVVRQSKGLIKNPSIMKILIFNVFFAIVFVFGLKLLFDDFPDLNWKEMLNVMFFIFLLMGVMAYKFFYQYK